MSYKPKYCCECGDTIERTDWKWTSSRRFCELCETQFRIADLLPRVAVVGGILLGIFGLAAYWQKPVKSFENKSQQLISASVNANKNAANQNAAPQVSAKQSVPITESRPTADLSGETQITANSSVKIQKPNQFVTAPNIPAVKIYYCGAQTKKGTLCTHKVKGGGRCWQHLGQPAMLPPDKLLVSR